MDEIKIELAPAQEASPDESKQIIITKTVEQVQQVSVGQIKADIEWRLNEISRLNGEIETLQDTLDSITKELNLNI